VLIPVALVIFQPQAAFNPAVPEPVKYPNPAGLTIGNTESGVLLEEYGDFQCPACKRFDESVFPLLLADYIEPGLVSFTFRTLPILDSSSPDRESHLAAEAALCAADQDAFWPYHDMLYANQDTPNSGRFLQPNLEQMAAALDLDVAAFSECLTSGTYREDVVNQLRLGLQSGIQATPTLVLNGEVLEWATYAELQALLDAAVETAANAG